MDNKKDFDAVSASITQSLIFLISSIIARAGQIAILWLDGADLTRIASPSGVYMILSDDVEMSLIVFLVLFFVFHAIRKRDTVRLKFVRIAYALEFIYLVYVMAYIGYFRLFRKPLSSSLSTAIFELFHSTKSTLTDAFGAESPWHLVLTFILYYVVVFKVWPMMGGIDFRRHLPKEGSAIVLLAIALIAANELTQAMMVDGIPVVGENSMDLNPLKGFFLSFYNNFRLHYFEGKKYQPSFSQNETGMLLIDPEYPFMVGSEYAICNHPNLSHRPQFSDMCSLDEDGDGFTKREDCNDRNPSINPNAIEVGYNTVDENCDTADNPPFNVIIIMLEGMSPDYMQVYNNSLQNTPNLLRYGNESFLSYGMYSNVATSPSAEFMSYCSFYPYDQYYALKLTSYQYLPCISDVLKANGYRIGYFNSMKDWGVLNAYPKSKGSWDIILDKSEISTEGFLETKWGVEEKALIKPFFSWVKSDNRPFFAVLRCSTGHEPIKVPEGYDKFKDDKQNAAFYIDSFIGEVLDNLRYTGLENRTIVVIQGDHTRWRFDFGKIPFIMINPAIFRGGVSSDTPASLIDVTPTILDVIDIKSINSFQGKSIFKLNGTGRRVLFFYTDISKNQEMGLREGNIKFVFNPETASKKLYRDDKEITKESESQVEEYYTNLMVWVANYKTVYQTNRIFDKSLLE
ncbi:MAG: sulfatase-like hydrolase/transferase [Candidatus Altiarchaeota archaeon]